MGFIRKGKEIVILMTTKRMCICKSWIKLNSSLEISQSSFMVFLQAIAISHSQPAGPLKRKLIRNKNIAITINNLESRLQKRNTKVFMLFDHQIGKDKRPHPSTEQVGKKIYASIKRSPHISRFLEFDRKF